MSAPVKRSLTVRGRRTSESVEGELWRACGHIGAEQDRPIKAGAAEIDATRDLDSGLASEIRLLGLRYYRDRQAGSG